MIEARGTKVVVKPDTMNKKSDSGLILPDVASNDFFVGTIVSAGPGYKTRDGKYIPLEVTTGDKIHYGKDCGEPYVDSDGEVYLILDNNDILCVVEG